MFLDRNMGIDRHKALQPLMSSEEGTGEAVQTYLYELYL